MATATLPEQAATGDTFPINGTDYIEFYVGNAKQAAHYYQRRVRLPARRLSRSGDRACATGRATCSSRTRSASCSRPRSART